MLKQSNKILIITVACVMLFGCVEKTAQEHMQKASEYAQQGELDAAVVEMKNAVIQEPQNAQARFTLGRYYLTLGRLGLAAKELRKALEAGYDPEQVVPPLMRSYYLMDQLEAALLLADRHSLKSPEAVSQQSLYRYLSALRDGTGVKVPWEDAQAHLMDKDESLALAYTSYRNNNWEEAREYLAAADQALPEVDYLRGLIAYESKQYRQAVSALTKYKQTIEYVTSADFLLVMSLLDAGDFELAAKHTERLAEINDAHPLVNSFKARLAYHQENFEDASQFAEIAIQNGYDTIQMRILATVSALKIKSNERAYRHLIELRSRPDFKHDEVDRLLANLQLQQGYLDEAISSLNAIEQPTDTDALLFAQAGTQAAVAGDEARGQKLLEKAVGLNKDSPLLKTNQALLKMGQDNREAIKLLSEALAQDNTLAPAWSQKAIAQLRDGDEAGALQTARQWQQVNKPDGLVMEGIIKLSTGNEKKASALFRQALSLDPKHVGANLYLLRALQQAENYQGRFEHSQDMLKRFPDNARAYATLVADAIRLERVATARSLIEQLQQKHPQMAQPKEAEAMLYSAQNDPEQTVNVLQSLTDLSPMGHALLGDALFKLNKVEQAQQAFENWRTAYPQQLTPYLRLIGIQEARGNWQQALQLVEEGLVIYAEPRELKLLQLHYLTKLNLNDRAQRVLEEVRSERDTLGSPLLPYYEGQLALNQRDFRRAVTLLSQHHELAPDYTSALMLAKAYVGLGKQKTAQQVLEDHIKNTDSVSNAFLFQVAGFYAYLNNHQKAADIYQRLLNEDNDNPVYLNNLAYSLMQTDNKSNIQRAVTVARQAVDLAPANPDFLDTYGVTQLRAGKPEEAYSILKQANELAPDDITIKLHYAEALIKVNMRPKARELLRSITQGTQQELALKRELMEKV